MAEPWKDFAAPGGDGPWNEFAAPNAAPPQPAAAIQRPKSGLLRRAVGDTAVDLGRGVVGVGEAVAGLANLATFGGTGKVLDAVGFDPELSKNMIGELYSPERKEAQQKVSEAEGFVGTASAMLQNPSTIAGTVVESLPAMLGGGAIGQAVRRVVPRLGAIGAAALGEGAIGAGQSAEGIRQEMPDKELGAQQVAAAVGSGIGTAALGAGGGALARRLGIADPDVLAAGGGLSDLIQRPGGAALRTARGTAAGAVTEGVFEELPQSMQEQAWQNFALGRPLGEGVAEAAATGLLAGAAMGGPVGGYSAAVARPRRGSLEDAANVVQPPGAETSPPAPGSTEGGRAATGEIDPGLRRPTAPDDAALSGSIEVPGVPASELLERAATALDKLRTKRDGTQDSQGVDEDGNARTIKGQPPQLLTDTEKATLDFLEANHQNPEALARRLGVKVAAPSADNLPFPIARPGSLADAGNAIAQAQAQGAAQAAPEDSMHARMLREQAAAAAAPAAQDDSDLGARPPSNLDPETGEELGIDAERWPAAPEHHQPAAIVRALVAQAAQNKNKPAGVTAIASTFNVSKDTARALRNRAISEMQAEAGSPRRADAPAQGTLQEGQVNESAPQAEDSVAPASLPAELPVKENWTDRGGWQTRANISDSRTEGTVGALYYDLRRGPDDYSELNLWVTRDGKLTQRQQALSADGTHPNLWRDGTPEQKAEVLGLLRRRGDTRLGSPERKAIDQQIKAIVTGSMEAAPAAATAADPTPTSAGAPAAGAARTGTLQTTPPSGQEDASPAAVAAAPAPVASTAAAAAPAAAQVEAAPHGTPAAAGETAPGPTLAAPIGESPERAGPVSVDPSEGSAAAAGPAVAVQASAQPQATPAAPTEQGADLGRVFGAAYVRAYGEDRALPEERYQQAAAEIARMVEAKAADALRSRNLGDPKASPGGRAVFEAITGVKLPKGRRAAEAAIDAWAGISTEERAQRTAAKQQKAAAKRAEDELEHARRRADAIPVAGENGATEPGGAYIDRILGEGFTQVVQRGGHTWLVNSDGRGFRVPTKQLAQYARLAAARAPAAEPRPAAPGDDLAAQASMGTQAPSQGLRGNYPELEGAAPAEQLAARANEAATSPQNDRPEPTPAQKEAGNYAKGHIRINGHDISVENPAGSRRDPKWPALKDHYGYIRGTVGKDKDHVDVFMTENAHDESRPVFVVDQVNKDGGFDEHKVVMGAVDEADARATYLRNYSKGWTGLGAITQMSQDEFKAWLRDPKRTSRPAGKLAKPAPPARAATEGRSERSFDASQRRLVDEAPNGIRVGDRVVVADERRGSYEATVTEIEVNAAPVYQGTAFKVAQDDAKPDGRGTGWVGIHRISRAGAVAQEPESPAAPPAPATEGQAAEPAVGTGDAGEELWYNRRNRSGAGVQWSDVEGLNDTLKVKEVVKSKVWPRPDYEQLVADGLRPEFAHLVKQVYDTLATKPRVRGVPTDQQLQDYIETVGKVREAVFAFVRDNSRVRAALDAATRSASALLRGGPVSMGTLTARDESMLDAVFPKAPGESSRWRSGGRTNENNARANLVGSNKLVRALQVTGENFTDAIKAVAAGWPAPQEAWQRIYKIRQYRSGWSVTRRGRTVARELPTKEEAEAAAKAHYDEARQTGKGGMAAEARAVEQAQRIGPAHRRPDEDISSERLMETFGLRGINFGNWMKGDTAAKQRERQLHLNHAYDALLDLSEITGLPPKAISLEGKLGLAFGAQGSGRAAAHFVPGVNEINLTRRTGAGGIAHEWAHALDHYFATQAGEVAARAENPYLTQIGRAERELAGIRPEISRAFQQIVNAMQRRPLTQAELDEREARARQHNTDQIERALAPLRAELPDGDEAALATFDELADRLRAGDQGEGTVPTGRKVRGLRPRTRVDEEISQVAGQMLGLLREHGAAAEIVLPPLLAADSRAGIIAYQAQQAEQRKSHVPQTGEVNSNYLNEAHALESKSAKQGTGKRYWSTPWELFARAFESYAIDRLATDQRRSDYLSWPQMSESSAKAMKEAGLIDGDRYPRGAERTRINGAFDTLLSEIKTEDTAEGQVRLFSKPPADAATDETFFSALLRAVEAAKGAPRRAAPAAWKQWLDGAQRRGELKQEERDWLGVDAWLDGQESVTREALADYVRANQVQVQEVVLGDTGLPDGWTVALDPRLVDDFGGTWIVRDEHGEERGRGDSRREAIEDAQDPEADAGEREAAGETRHEQYQLPGGQNYRELLLTLPTSPNAGGNLEVRQTSSGRWELVDTAEDALIDTFSTEREALAERAAMLADPTGQPPSAQGAALGERAFRSNHWNQPNVLAHVRFNERTDADGKRVLFLEEIQSDWHQEGRRGGYRQGLTADARARIAEAEASFEASTAAGENAADWRQRHPEHVAALNERAVAEAEFGVPDAPFKTTWPALAFKRMVRYAADHGFERIAWTTGEQQAERYDLSKQVGAVEYTDTGRLMIEGIGGNTLFSGMVPEHKIADHVGKEVADRLLADTPRNRPGLSSITSTSRRVSGDGLKIGGDGMRGFYDRMLPTEVNKLVKRFGAKVGTTTVPTASQYAQTFDPAKAEVVDRGGVFQVWVDGRLHGGNFDSREAAEAHVRHAGGTPVHSVDVTPDMRRAALGGQPLFSSAAGAAGSAPLTFDRALQLKARITGEWGENAPTIHLVESAEDFPAWAKVDPDYRRAEGVWGGRQQIWINVGGIATEKRFAEVMAHEAIGHFGVEAVVGRDQWTGIVASIANHDRNGTGAPSLRRAMRDVHRRYGRLDAETFAKETIAVMAEQGARNGIMARVVAAVRAFLRRVMPDLAWSAADVTALLAASDSYLRAGRSQAESRAAVAAAAFSQPGDPDAAAPSPADAPEITDADREAQKIGRRQIRGITPHSKAADIYATIAALNAVKARLRDLPPVAKPDPNAAPDFETAQAVGEFWKALTAGEGIQEYGLPPPGVKDLQEIADAVVFGDQGRLRFTRRGRVPGQGLQYGITTPRGRSGTLELRDDGTLQLHIGGLTEGEGEGRALYMVVNTWAARNGYRALPDEGGLTPINAYRRTQMMASSALRDGGTAHLSPALQQRLPHWREGDFGRPPSAAEQRFNTGYLFIKGTAQALNIVPLLDRVQFNFDTGRFEDTKGREFSDADFDALLSQLATRKIGMGRRTAKRAVLTGSALRELAGQTLDFARQSGRRLLDDPAGPGSDLRGEDGPGSGLVAPQPLRGVLYSLGDGPQLETDARGQRTIRAGGAVFREVGNRFYLTDRAGRLRDFRDLDAARAEADRLGAELRIDDPADGEPQTYSVVLPETAERAAGVRRPLFSKAPEDVLADIDAVMADSHREGLFERAKQWLKDATPKKIKDELRGTWLGALTARHLTELGGDYFQNIGHYSEFLARQQADQNSLAAEAEAIAEHARKWAGKNRAEARRLFDLMHKATIDGVDPAEDYRPLHFEYGGTRYEATQKNVKDALRAIREQMLGRSGDNKKDMMAEAKRIREMPARERARRKKYPSLVEQWNALSPEAKAIYTQFRDAYAERSNEVEKALVARINDTDAPDNRKRQLINTIRMQFETQRLEGVYFPLQRFGRYFVAAEKGGTSTFLMFERLSELERGVKRLKDRGFRITAQGLKSAGKAKDAPSGTFVAEIIEQLRKSGVSDQTQDQIYQIYLQSLPELSMRKHSIHRKSVPGFDHDAVRGFAFNMHHGSHQLARLRWAHKRQGVLELLKQQQDAARREPEADTRRIAAGDAILEELNRRDEWINNPQDSQTTNLVSSFGFGYYLGLTPAAAMVNLTQTAMVSFPWLAARYGHAKAMNELLKGMAASGRTVGNIQNTLTDPVERQAHAVLQQMGAIDKTQAHNLAGIAEGGLVGYNPKWAKAMEIVGWAFHKAEVVNREATGMAAFRLARAAGESFEQAVKTASTAIYDTHFDYSNANRARFMQSGAAKVLLMFRQFSLNMTWHLARMTWQATKGQDPEVRALARRNLAGVLGMASLFAGVLGLPMMKATMGVLNAVAASGGDDDEPWDAETEFRAFLASMLGPGVAELVLTGPVNALTGADVHSRVSLSEIWFRDADRELDGRGQYYHLLEQAAGPMGGVLKNALVGKALIDEGHTWRGIETMLPKALKDSLKSIRYQREGVNSLRGDPVLEDPSLWQNLLQLQGFTPAQAARQYDTNRSLKNYEQHILDRRQHLMNALAMAYRLDDQESRAETMAAIAKFNRTHPEIGITPASIRRSIASRARYSAKAEAGIVLNPRIAAKVRAQVVGEN